jgi:hypothetical protein
MLPVNPRLPPTAREVPAIEAPEIEGFDPNRELPIDELPKCEPSIFDTARFGEIAELRADDPAIPRTEEPEALPMLGACEFDAIMGPVVPADPARADPASDELPEFAPEPANERAPAAAAPLLGACVPAVLPVLPLAFPPVLPPLPPNDCHCRAATAAPRPACPPVAREVFPPVRAALFPKLRADVDPPKRPFDGGAAARPPFIPFERAPPYTGPRYPREAYPPGRP